MYSIVIPVLNEKENLKVLLPGLLSPNCEIIVCDNGSKDGTQRLVEDAQSSFGFKLSKGSGTVVDAVLRGMKLVSCDRIIVMDGDLSHDFQVVPKMAKALDEYDMVIGSRYTRGGCSRDTFLNRFISRGFNLLSYPLAPKVKDRASGFFGIRQGLADTPIRNTVKPMLEYLVRANPTSVVEIPYTFQPRTRGKAKLGKPIMKSLVDLGFLYLQKFNRFIKYCCVGGIGTLVVLATTYLFTEVAGLWYMFSVVAGAFAAAIWNFTGHRFITYAREKAHLECDYEWKSWYKGNPLQKWWKHRIGSLTKEYLGNPGSLLDVGCGSSPVINLFHCTRIGIDRDQKKLDFIGRYSGAEFLQYDLDVDTNLNPVWGQYFDAVICNNFLEHIHNPEGVVGSISRVLKPGGKAVLTVPNSGNPFTEVVEWLYGKMMPGGYQVEHCCKFTPRYLDKLCRGQGLGLVKRKAVFTDMVCLYEKVEDVKCPGRKRDS